jgi:hypothetical protein
VTLAMVTQAPLLIMSPEACALPRTLRGLRARFRALQGDQTGARVHQRLGALQRALASQASGLWRAGGWRALRRAQRVCPGGTRRPSGGVRSHRAAPHGRTTPNRSGEPPIPVPLVPWSEERTRAVVAHRRRGDRGSCAILRGSRAIVVDMGDGQISHSAPEWNRWAVRTRWPLNKNRAGINNGGK